MPDLERALRELGRELSFPATPELVPALGERLRAAPPPRAGRRRVVVLAFAVAAVGLVAALAVPQARTAILELLGIRGATVERVSTAPEAPAAEPDLGEGVTVAEARRRVAFRVLVPADPPGEPEAFLREPPAGGMVSLLYRAKDGRPLFVLSQFRGTELPFVGKVAGPGTEVRRVDVAGAEGLWIEGAPHVVRYRDERGRVREETARLAGNVLLWERRGITYRIEGAVGAGEALRVARSLRDP